MKKCAKCGVEKPLSEFRKKVDGKFGVGARCKSCINNHQAPNKKNRHLKGYDRFKHNYYLRKYNITLEDVKFMLKQQNCTCAICKSKFKNGKDTHVDHCHITGKVRGLLCTCCNLGLGKFKDSTDLLESAQKYLQKYAKNLSKK
jgi:hypothetical protein